MAKMKPVSVEPTVVESQQPTRLSQLPEKSKTVRLRNKVTGMPISVSAKAAKNLLQTKPHEYELA